MRRYGALLLLAGDGDVERLLGFDFVDFDLDDIVLLFVDSTVVVVLIDIVEEDRIKSLLIRGGNSEESTYA